MSTPQVSAGRRGGPPGQDGWPGRHGPPWVRGAGGRPRGRPVAAVLLVVQLGITYLASRHGTGPRLDLAGAALLAVASVAPAWTWRFPVPVLVATVLATATYLGLSEPGGPVVFGALIATVVASVRGHRIWVWSVLTAGVVLSAVATHEDTAQWPSAGSLTGRVVLAAGAGVIAELARERSQRYAEMREGRQERSRRQASDERLRLAQELHDVLAHDVSLINVQASTALHLFDEDPGRARDALAAIKEVSHETLQELRATVSALRREDDAAPLRPAAGLADLDELAARSTAAGLAVELVRTGDVRALPPRVELAAYRIVQEAVTNARRHSGGRGAQVRLEYGDDDLAVTVTDDGGGRPAGVPDGHGLVGMRERAAALGGELTIGPGTAGGFHVAARIPLQAKGSDT
ncbi:MAG TPA: sensor histidine kinase [Actinomycetes bacterium]|nr:sensor histidine kinase [Actinomycetes bacterium]